MKRRGITLLEMTLAIGITSIIGIAIASMMAAATTGLTAKDDGRQSAIRLATTQVRLGAYIAPSRCLLDKSSSHITLWFDDSNEGGTVNVTEVRWIEFDEDSKELTVKFIDFPVEWSQEMIDASDIECNSFTDFEILLDSYESSDVIDTVTLVDSIHSCNFWTNDLDSLEATRISIRFSLESRDGNTHDAIIDETIRHHQEPSEQQ